MGTHWKLEGNKKGTCCEQRKNEKNSFPHPKLKRKKIKAPCVHASVYPLAACIFGFQNCWSPKIHAANGYTEACFLA
jgi:hypothetical protein